MNFGMLPERLKVLMRKLIRWADKRRYGRLDFVVVSNNCWGAEIYRYLGKEYNTPFVGLFIFGPDYLKLVSNFDAYMERKLTFTQHSRWVQGPFSYPLGLLGDVEIHFLHYHSSEEALDKWDRRTKRMYDTQNPSRYFFKICDRDLADKETISGFHQLALINKVSFAIFNTENPGHLKIIENDGGKCVPDGVSLFWISFRYFDLFDWISSGKISSGFINRLRFLCFSK